LILEILRPHLLRTGNYDVKRMYARDIGLYLSKYLDYVLKKIGA